MKKFLTLTLALALTLCLAAPALAFTNDDQTPSTKSPFKLDIYLVEHQNDEFFGITGWPPSDRGYAKNEIVAAVVELYVPKGKALNGEGYEELIFSGENVSLNVTDNKNGTLRAVGFSGTTDTFTLSASANTLKRDLTGDNAIPAPTANKTYKWLFFSKVTADDALMSAKLVDGTAPDSFTGSSLEFTLGGVNYNVTLTPATSSTDQIFTITAGNGDYSGAKILIRVDRNFKSLGMAIDPAGSVGEYALGVNVSGELGIVGSGGAIVTSGSDYNAVMDVYDDVAADVFGFNYFLIGNYVRKSFFENLTSSNTLTATVDIKPWTAHVTVPDVPIVTSPKTGAAASILGFVMVAVSGAAALTLRKR